MSRGLGKIERVIAAEIADAAIVDEETGKPGTVLISSWELLSTVYEDHSTWDFKWKPTPAARKAVTRAMHSFVRKHQQYALTGGQGRRQLYLYDAADPISVIWAKLNVERRQRNMICRSDAVAALAQLGSTGAPAGELVVQAP